METWIVILNVTTLVAVLFSLTRKSADRNTQNRRTLESTALDQEILERIERKLDRVFQHLSNINAFPQKSELMAEEIQKTLTAEVEVILLEVPNDCKISVLKAVREITGFGLKQAKHLIESTPKPVLRYVNMIDAEKAVKKLEEAGGLAMIGIPKN